MKKRGLGGQKIEKTKNKTKKHVSRCLGGRGVPQEY
jgi:hypothetical protein